MNRKPLLNPLDVAKGLAKLNADERLTEQLIAQFCIIALRAGEVDDAKAKHIVRHLVMAQIVAADRQVRSMYDLTVVAIRQWLKCWERATSRGLGALQPSTAEREAVLHVLQRWQVTLGMLPQGNFTGAEIRWLQHRDKFIKEAGHA